MRAMIVAVLIVLAVVVLGGQAVKPVPVSVVSDWTDRHVIFPQSNSIAVMINIQRDPRYWQQWWRRVAVAPSPVAGRASPGVTLRPRPVNQRDWSVSLGGASVRPQSFPAKFTFDVTQTPSCTADYVVTGINAAGSSSQANIIGLNWLYTNSGGTGFCSGTAPAVMFAYNVGLGLVPAAVVISLDGKKLAFNENNGTSSYFHVLTYATGAGNGTDATHPATPGSKDRRVALGEATTTTPFVDYLNDTAYVTTTTRVHKFRDVFKGTPAEVTSGGWPYTHTGTVGLSTPVFDLNTRHVFFKDFEGHVHYLDDSVTPAVLGSNTFAIASTGDNTARPVIVDSTNQKIYGYSSNGGGTYSVVGQADLNLSSSSRVTVNVGLANTTSARQPFAPDFNNYYYTGDLSRAYLYAVSSDSSGNRVPSLYRVGFGAGWRLNSATANGPTVLATNTSGLAASPLTTFYNSRLGKDFLFVGISDNCQSTPGVTGGCIRSIDITDPAAFPTSASVNSVILPAAGGTSGITVDNISAAREASSVYYVTLSGNTLVKATQATLE